MAETPNFGLTRIQTGEQITARGNAYTDRDRLTIDALLHALQHHTHTGTERLRNPSQPPALTLNAGSGSLASDTTFYYRVALVDKWGLESAASGEASVTTPTGLEADTAPTLALTSGGSLPANTFSYVYTWVASAGGESTASPVAQVVTDGIDGTVTLTLPALPSGASQANVYRARLGLSNYYYVGATSTGTFVDAGLPDDCCGSTPPAVSTATSSASVTIEPNSADLITDAAYWRAYRTTIPGTYLTTSLVAEAPIGVPITDTGQAMLAGMPRSTSSTAADAAPLDDLFAGTRTITVALPAIQPTTDPAGTDTWQFDCPSEIQPTRLTLTCATNPTGRTTEAVDFVLDSTGGGNATLTMDDNSGVYTAVWPTSDAVAFDLNGWANRFLDTVDDGSGAALTLITLLNAAGTHQSLLARASREEAVLEAGQWQVEVLAKGDGALTLKNYLTQATESLLWTGVEFTVNDEDDYAWYPAGTFSTAVPVTVFHSLTTGLVFTEVNVARIRYTAVKPTLEPGLVTLRHDTFTGGTIGDGFTLTLWY